MTPGVGWYVLSPADRAWCSRCHGVPEPVVLRAVCPSWVRGARPVVDSVDLGGTA